MSKLTIAKFVTDGEYKILKTTNRKSPPVVLSASELDRIKRDLVAKICQYAPKRPSPGGQLSHPSMWGVKERNLKGKSAAAYQFEVTALKESPLEERSIFKHADNGRSTKNNRQHYAWWVEFGHRVVCPDNHRSYGGKIRKTKLPFMVENGKLWRVNVEGWGRTTEFGGSRSYRVLARPVWDDFGEFTRRKLVPVKPKWENTTVVNGRQYRRQTNRVLWLKPGTKTSYKQPVYFVKHALEEISEEIFQLVWNATFDPKQIPNMHPSVVKMWAKRKPVGIITEDHYDTEALLKTHKIVEGMYSLVIREGK